MKYIHIIEYHNKENQQYSFSRYFSSEKKAKEEVRNDSKIYGITPKFEKTDEFIYVTDQHEYPFFMNEDYKSRTFPAIITKKIIK